MPIAKSRILFEDDHLLFVNKRSAELSVQGFGSVQKLSLFDFLKKEYSSLRPLNRLDFETSGIMVFAKTKKAFELSREQMREWNKKYLTLVKGPFKYNKGIISIPISARSSEKKINAETRYKVIGTAHGISFVEATINSGKFHQIRIHLAGIHHPLVLDTVYGDKKFNSAFKSAFKYRKFFLHASCITFTHPITDKKIDVIADIPESFKNILKELGIGYRKNNAY